MVLGSIKGDSTLVIIMPDILVIWGHFRPEIKIGDTTFSVIVAGRDCYPIVGMEPTKDYTIHRTIV